MDVSAIQRSVQAADVPMEQLAGNSHLSEEQKIAEATRQFEAILLRQILENTQKTVIKSKYSDESTAAGIYRDLVTSQLADSISKSGDLGLGKKLQEQFTQSSHSHPAETHSNYFQPGESKPAF
jgi:Rod binding domain-containing protein